MTRSLQLVRLLASVAISLAACLFVVAYNHASATRFQFDHPGATTVTPFNEFVGAYGICAYAVPLAGLLVGTLTLWRRPNSHVLIELIVSALWVLALIWSGLVLLSWQIQNIPIFSGMRWHY